MGDDQIRQWFFDNASPQYLYKTKCTFDRQTNRVYIFFASNASTTCDFALVYHVKSGQWGRANNGVQAALNYVSGGVTFDTFNVAGATFDTLTSVSYDSQYWLAGGFALSVFDSTNQLRSLTGTPAASSFTTGDAGDDEAVTLLKQVRLRYAAGRAPTTATAAVFRKKNSGDVLTTGATGTLSDGKFDVMQAARWHRARFSFTGPVRVIAMNPTLTPAGKR